MASNQAAAFYLSTSVQKKTLNNLQTLGFSLHNFCQNSFTGLQILYKYFRVLCCLKLCISKMATTTITSTRVFRTNRRPDEVLLSSQPTSLWQPFRTPLL
jgi:hypothetical protein